MPYHKIVLYIVWCVCIAGIASAQEFSTPEKPALMQCDSLHPADMLSVGENPAWLFEHERVIPLKVNVTQRSSSGDFHTPFEPANATTYQYYVEGQKQIGANHVVGGSFGLVQEFRGNWMWMDTKAYDTGNPFLIADSGTGMTEYHGILLNGTYSGNWLDNILVGARIQYAVSNAVKRVSPKPIAVSRDFGFTLGGAYMATASLTLGASFLMSNGKEENDFSADQTTLQSQTIIYKFRGIDSYQRFTKNTENRLNEMDSYGGRLHAALSSAHFSGTLYAGVRVRSSTITDGGSSPVSQGYWQSEIVEASGALTCSVDKIRITAIADAQTDRQWTEHPDFSVVLLEQHLMQARAGGLVTVPVSSFEVFGGYTLTYHQRTIDDYAGALSADLSSLMHTGILGGGIGLNDGTAIQLWYAADIVAPQNTRVTVAAPSLLYAYVGRYDFAFQTAAVFASSVGLTVNMNTGLFGMCSFDGIYHVAGVSSSAVFSNASRSTVEIRLSTQF